jgi:hypothetical protein
MLADAQRLQAPHICSLIRRPVQLQQRSLPSHTLTVAVLLLLPLLLLLLL